MDKKEISLSIEQIIKERDDFFIVGNVLGENGDLNLTSIEALELLFMLEDKFDITISDDELNLEILKSIDTLTDFIQHKKSE